jgi:DNA (cytosine-5)-methyltransferase 1
MWQSNPNRCKNWKATCVISTTEQTNYNGCRQLKRSEGIAAAQNSTTTGAAVLDLCSGLGGLSLAAKELGLHIVAGVDVNKDALKTFSKNFPIAQVIEGSVRSKTILARCEKLLEPFKTAKQPTMILSGPPCQGFSAAGTRDPADPRNQVLVAVARAISKLEPTCALIENVSMVLADKHGNRVDSFETILKDAGFHVTNVILDASEFGVPQKRKRAFFLVTKGQVGEEDLITQLDRFKTKTGGARQALRGLSKPEVRPDDYNDEHDYGNIYNHFAMQHSSRVKKKIAAIDPGTGPMSYRRLHPTRLSNTLFSGHRAPPAHFKEPRSITVREAARLQGFPDSFRVYGSFSNQMEQVTNAVPPPLARAVLQALAEISGLTIRSNA